MTCLVVGYDGSAPGERALEYAKRLAKLIGDCELRLVFVIEWSPYSFHTPEELEERHARREDEISRAHEAVLDPAVDAAKAEGFTVTSEIRHGDAASLLDEIATERGATQIIIGRVGAKNVRERLFGGVSGNLVATATVPVTIIP
jgi:nucleotide-binding universal stress UspA family protein